MKLKFFIFFTVFLSCCKLKEKLSDHQNTNIQCSTENIDSFSIINKYEISGDFDGDGKTEILKESIFSTLNKAEVDSFPNYRDDYYCLYNWLNDVGASLSLISTNKISKLHLSSSAVGLFYLENIGDNNNNGTDEIALVINYSDFSNLNTCLIYEYCNSNWQLMFSFPVNEFSFYFEENEIIPQNGIKGYFEKKNNLWLYSPYNAEMENVVMQKLSVTKCD